ncbi:MAG: double zinc ribbon domain-containing protein [Candidatus Bipolaricaulota bacterium]
MFYRKHFNREWRHWERALEYSIAAPKLYCPSCNHEINKDHAVCPHCHKDLKTNCPYCGAIIRVEWRRCPKCNNSLPDEKEDQEI